MVGGQAQPLSYVKTIYISNQFDYGADLINCIENDLQELLYVTHN
jgi:hypothetical protein